MTCHRGALLALPVADAVEVSRGLYPISSGEASRIIAVINSRHHVADWPMYLRGLTDTQMSQWRKIANTEYGRTPPADLQKCEGPAPRGEPAQREDPVKRGTLTTPG